MAYEVRTLQLAFLGGDIWQVQGNGLLMDGKYPFLDLLDALERLNEKGWELVSSHKWSSSDSAVRAMDLYRRRPLI